MEGRENRQIGELVKKIRMNRQWRHVKGDPDDLFSNIIRFEFNIRDILNFLSYRKEKVHFEKHLCVFK